MTISNKAYSLFHKFFEAHTNAGIEGVLPDDPLLLELEQSTKANKQLVYLADGVLLDILFVSTNVFPMFGIQPEEVTLGYFVTTTHPEDQKRHSLARTKLFLAGQELFMQKKGSKLISSNVRARKPDGSYFNALYQAYLITCARNNSRNFVY